MPWRCERVVAWWRGGDNLFGETNVPPTATRVIAIAAGAYHGLALRADGTVVAWGENDSGQATVPPSATNIIAIAAGGYFSGSVARGRGHHRLGIGRQRPDRHASITGPTGFAQGRRLSQRRVAARPADEDAAAHLETTRPTPVRHSRTNGNLSRLGSCALPVHVINGCATARSFRVKPTSGWRCPVCNTAGRGYYQFIATNDFGSVTSLVANLGILQPPQVTQNVQPQTVVVPAPMLRLFLLANWLPRHIVSMAIQQRAVE